MRLKTIFATLLLLSSITFVQSQSKDILAKSAMLNADESFGKGEYKECLDYLLDAATNLGKTNSRIQYLKVKALMALGNSDQYNKTLWLQADTALNKFFQVTPENGYDQEKYDEMLMAVSKIKKYIAASAEAASSLNHEMILVQGGTFQMGSNESDDEKPIHPVTLGNFYIGKTEVPQKLWLFVMGNNPSRFKDCDNCPVENVSWNDVQDFIQKLNQKTGKTYRLPTEAEWEYAARGGNKSRGYTYSGSNTIDEVAWYRENSGSKTHAVGQKQPNELGIFDMTGNVWEWCSDWYKAEYYAICPASNPKGPSSGSNRVLRGGSWINFAQYCRASFRFFNLPDYRFYFLGFRLVLVP